MENESWISPQLRQLQADGLERTLNVLPRAGGKFQAEGREFLNFSSNDYLNLSRDPASSAAPRQPCSAMVPGLGRRGW